MGGLRSVVERIIKVAATEGRDWLLEPEAKEVCKAYGIPIPAFKVVGSEEEAVLIANQLKYPLVVKVVSPDVPHKSDVGGVVLNVTDQNVLRTAYRNVLQNVKRFKPKARVLGVLIEEQAPPSVEVIVGLTVDPQFGPAVMFGLGGVFVEVLKDVSFRIAPIEEDDAWEMVREVKGYPILDGYRGRPRLDVEAVVKMLVKVSDMAMENPEIQQLDLNPVLVYEKGALAVDARIGLRHTHGDK
ncbi:MAG: acetate--CoA ligase family protein [Candidatus Nezhaarchaeales archaeon]